MQRNLLNASLAAGVAVVVLVSMLTPWWTAQVETSGNNPMFGGDFSSSGDASARPFDDEGLISSGKAALSGTLVLLSFLAAATVAVLQVVRPEAGKINTALAVGASFLVGLAALLAITTWPGDGTTFWDSGSSSAMGFSSAMSFYAGFGWYAAILAFLAGAVVAFLTLPQGSVSVSKAPRGTPVDAPAAKRQASSAPAQCQGITKSGSQCSRRASNGSFCATHG